jgi:hypothetical protein
MRAVAFLAPSQRFVPVCLCAASPCSTTNVRTPPSVASTLGCAQHAPLGRSASCARAKGTPRIPSRRRKQWMVPLLQVGALCGPDAVREFGLLTTPQLHFAVREHRREPYVAATIHAVCRGDHMQVRQHNLGLCSLEGTYYDEARPALSRCFAIAQGRYGAAAWQ